MTRSFYIPRTAERRLQELMAEASALMIVGPRAAGKTTMAGRYATATLRLDDPAVAAAVRANPDAALSRATEPLLIDEWQEVPEVLGAVKRAVDTDPRPGRFLLTGSSDPAQSQKVWPGTGRIIRIPLHCLTERELHGDSGTSLVPLLESGDLDDVGFSKPPWIIDDYIHAAVRGGFPEPALRLKSLAARSDWYSSYIENVVTRDIANLGRYPRPARLRQYLRAMALSTGGLPTDATLGGAAGIDRRTATGYDDLLERLYLYEAIPAWSTNRIKRLQKRAKRYLVDTGIASSAAGVTAGDILLDGDMLGRILDTFVVEQLRPEFAVERPRITAAHVRTESGRHEIDLVAELGANKVIGFEVKATSAPGRSDAVHLAWLRDRLGDRFVRGIVFHTGPVPFELDDRIWALPISSIWSSSRQG